MNALLLPAEKQNTSSVDIWDVIRSCELNVIFHPERGRKISGLAKRIDIFSGLLAAEVLRDRQNSIAPISILYVLLNPGFQLIKRSRAGVPFGKSTRWI